MYGNNELKRKKRVMVVVDEKSHSRHAMIWALSHVANEGDSLTLLHIIPPPSHTCTQQRPSLVSSSSSSASSSCLTDSLGSLCRACKPEVEVEGLVIQGPKLATVMSQVKKLEASVLVIGQKKSFPLFDCFCWTSKTEAFVDRCIQNAECLTISVRKQSKGLGGYLISTKWRKNFWLLA